MVLVVTLANHQHDVRHTITATIYQYLITRSLQLLYLSVGKSISVYTESEAIDGQIEICFLLLGHFVLHLSDSFAREKFVYRHLIIPRLRDAAIQQPSHHTAQYRLKDFEEYRIHLRQDESLVHPREEYTKDGPEDMHHHQ